MTRTHVLIGIGAIAMLSAVHVASAQMAKFEVLDEASTAMDLSPDGKWIVGRGFATGEGYLWSRETGYNFIGGNDAVGVSDDGTVVLGAIDHPTTGHSEAAIWSADEETWTILGTFPGGTGCAYETSPYELSADGTAAVGLAWHASGCSGQGFLWTQSGGTQGLQWLGDGGNRASVISADGALMGGFAQGSSNRTPAVWSADTMGALLDPGTENIVGEVLGMSDDGTTLLGLWATKAFKWVEGQPIELFSGPISVWNGNAMDIADDGTIIGFDSFSTTRQAWIRPNGGAPVNLRTHALSLGATDVPVLQVAMRVSASGNIVIGHNFFENGWRLNLCVPDLSGNGAVDFADILAIIAAWGPCTGCDEDLNGSGGVGFDDILVVIGAWGSCP